MSELTHIEYTRPSGAVMAFQVPAHLIRGGEMPQLREGEPIPVDIFRFNAPPNQVGLVPVGVLKYLLVPHGPGKKGNPHFCGVVERGELRFRRSDLRQLEYSGPVHGSMDPLLGQDESGEERAARLARESKLAEAEARAAVLDKELELERLRAQRAADERAKAEADARKAEAEAAVAAAAPKRGRPRKSDAAEADTPAEAGDVSALSEALAEEG